MNVEVGYNLSSLLWDVSYDIKVNYPGATADTQIDWGEVVSATVEYNYLDSQGATDYYTADMYFNSSEVPHFTVMAGTNNRITFTPYQSGGASARINATTSIMSLFAGESNNFNYNSGYDDSQSCNFLLPGKSSVPTLNYNGSGTLQYAGRLKRIKYTTDSSVNNRVPNAPYMPISGRSMSYNDVKLYVVNEYNEQNPSETINESDLPDFEDATEESGEAQPFSIDYNEILGERELESILAETRYVLDTTPYDLEIDYTEAIQEPYELLKDSASLDSGTKTAISKIYDVAFRIADDGNLTSMYAFVAVLSVIMWFVFRR